MTRRQDKRNGTLGKWALVGSIIFALFVFVPPAGVVALVLVGLWILLMTVSRFGKSGRGRGASGEPEE